MVHAQIRVTGQVQGVGFRPFVYKLAHELGLAGWVRNDSEGVEIAVEGEHTLVMQMIERLQSEPPALARIEKVTHDLAHTITGLHGFSIAESRNGKVLTGIAPDMAICPDCLAELFDPADRRYRHPFINCIHCGPRYTLTARLPYDRANTSMAKFTQCPACQREYDTPTTRRFHAQPNACPECGPRLSLFDAQWQPVANADPIAATAAAHRRRAGGRHQRHRRIPSGVQCAQRGDGRQIAQRQTARGKAVRGDGAEYEIRAALRAIPGTGRGAAGNERTSHRVAAQIFRLRCGVARRRARLARASA